MSNIKKIILLTIFFTSIITYDFCYCDETEKNVIKYRTNTIDPIAENVPKEIMNHIIKYSDEYINRLVFYLMKDTIDEFLKVKRIHDWIALNIVYDWENYSKFLSGDYWAIVKHDFGRVADLLRHKKGVCGDYAYLFDKMCIIAGIESRKISGITDQSEEPHAWNAVRINNKWYFVDVTWDAGGIPGKENKHSGYYYRTEYLFIEPEMFIFSHFPLYEEYQFLDEPITKEEFHNLYR